MFATHSRIHSSQQSSAIVFPPRMTVPKRLDELTAQSFLARCEAEIQADQQSWLILDFCETYFVDRCGVEVLTQIGKLAWERKFRIAAWSVHPQVENLLRTNGCDLFIQIDRRMQALPTDSLETSNPLIPFPLGRIIGRFVDVLETVTTAIAGRQTDVA